MASLEGWGSAIELRPRDGVREARHVRHHREYRSLLQDVDRPRDHQADRRERHDRLHHHSRFDQRDSGMVSVGLKAVALVKLTYR